MRPKVEAVCRFVRETGRDAAIGSLQEATAIVAGDAGTRISLLEESIVLAATENWTGASCGGRTGSSA